MTERCVCCSEGRLLGKPIRVMSRATLANALDGGSVTALPIVWDTSDGCRSFSDPGHVLLGTDLW